LFKEAPVTQRTLGFLLFMKILHYEHKPTESLWIRKHNKDGMIRLFCLIGLKKGDGWLVTKERFANEFKKVKKYEIRKFFEKDKLSG